MTQIICHSQVAVVRCWSEFQLFHAGFFSIMFRAVSEKEKAINFMDFMTKDPAEELLFRHFR
jgi:hypothetical protein